MAGEDTSAQGRDRPVRPTDGLGPFALAVRELSAARRREEVIDIVRRSAKPLSGARGVTFVLREGPLCHYLADDAETELWPDQRFPMEACISGWAMLNGMAAVIPDIYADPRIPHEAYRKTWVKSLIMTPLGEDRPMAALGAYWDHVRQPSDPEVALLGALANCAATALETIALLGELRAAASSVLTANEVNHRLKNTLAVVQSIARRSFSGGRALPEARRTFEARLLALADSHRLITDSGWTGVHLRDLLDGALGPFGYGGPESPFEVSRPDATLPPSVARGLALALHELATNATKHGALSAPEGRVSVTCAVDGSQLRVEWTEDGGPPVRPPTTEGLGMQLIRGLAGEWGGETVLEFRPDGVTCRLCAPLADS